MFASSQYPVAAAPERMCPRGAPLQAGEGRECEVSRRATAALLLPEGRIGAWLVLLAGACLYVLVHAVALA